MKPHLNQPAVEKLTQLKAELAASLAHEKTVEVAPPTGSWDHWPAGWMARRNYMIGLHHRQFARRTLRRKIRNLEAEIYATSERSVKRSTWRNMRSTETPGIKIDRDGNRWSFVSYNGDFCCIIRPEAK